MRILIGGHSRGVGKSTLLAAIRETLGWLPWTCIKISRHRHGHGRAMRLVESDPNQILLRAPDGRLEKAAAFVSRFQCTLVESNRLIHWIRPDIALFVARPTIADWKDSASGFLSMADAVIVVGPGELPHKFIGPVFRHAEGQPMSPELATFLTADGRVHPPAALTPGTRLPEPALANCR